MNAAIGMAVLVLLAGAWLTRPLWRAKLDERQRRRAANVAAFRQRLTELENDQAAGLLEPATADALRAELETRLLREAEVADTPVLGGRRSVVLTLIVAAFIAVAGGIGYWLDGTWKVQQQIAMGGDAPADGAVATGANPHAGTGGPQGTIDEMVAKLQERLKANPADTEGWAMLGRSYFFLEKYEDAAKAYAKGSELTNHQEPDLLVNEGEALALARDRDLQGRPQQLFEAALKLAPDHGKALWYAGLAAQQAGDADTAKAHWLELSKQDLPDELRTVLNDRLASVGATPPPVVASSPSQAPAPLVAQAGATPGAAGAPSAPAGEGFAMRVAVTVKPEIAAKVPPGATLFVFAKAASGPPMPLAVYRGLASELPREVRLDDTMAMMPALKLSMFDRWTISARVSQSGTVQPGSGDLQGSMTVGKADIGNAALALVIDQVVP